MTISDKATIYEQSVTMYSLSDNNILYWKDWAEKFIKCCKEKLGWEVEIGPGTSVGTVMGCCCRAPGIYWTINAPRSAAYDCDWTQPDGIFSYVQVENDNYQNHLRFTGWFKDFPIWPNGADENGIDQSNGRFDFVIYTGEGKDGEKIGFRIKYPICSIGYPYCYINWNDQSARSGNHIFGVPSISLYSSTKGDIENYYITPDNLYVRSYSYTQAIPNAEADELFNPAKGYVTFFGNELIKIGQQSTISYWTKSDINNTANLDVTGVVYESPLWSLELQTDEDFAIDNAVDNNYNTHRLFKNFWKNYNKFHYHVSLTGDTTYLYVSDDINNSIGLKLIVTTLESGEKAVMIARRKNYESNYLCECAAVTGNSNANPSQPDSSRIIKLPIRPYKKISSGVNRFSFSRLLIPTQASLCTDLYYVTKRDIDDSIADGQYVLVKDKQSQNHYFRVIPFGAQKTYEVSGDDTTYLAFPIADPPRDDSGE